MLLHDHEQLNSHAAGLLHPGFPLLDGGFADVEIGGRRPAGSLKLILICAGSIESGTIRQDSSKLRIVSLSTVPALYMPATVLWIASNASLLYLCLFFIGISPPAPELHFLVEVLVGLTGIQAGQSPEAGKLVLLDIDAILLGEKIGIDPVPASLGEDQGAV